MSMSDDMVAFLRDRLDEDEATARAATLGPWRHNPAKHHHIPGTPLFEEAVFAGAPGADATCVAGTGETDDQQSMRDAQHIARHDPARVLREIETKQRLLELHGIVHRDIGWLEDGEEESGEIPVCGLCVPRHAHFDRRADVPEGPCPTVRLLAAPYADHPDYRQEWAP